ncbi:SGNH/GDSL hydrolase family protein [Paenibacillus qinlingensis]|uniref:Lysophospholipase L1-like esterase n=1 Tax=Paenibacillus qinlingensis TaxID=1837343 RepID=A0ABU1NT06_9BACL|nr:SGNH/GDSL hydrolase family protein [Paenibacillus qinlingensis]MDR6550588.1 lysophospholipase L1-like esterase [Paenibacillus qinlingensis]
MVIFEQIQFHNVEELEPSTTFSGHILQRYPKEVRHRLGRSGDQRGRFIAAMSTGCEIRFVTEAPVIRITLSAPITGGDIVVYNGDYVNSVHQLEAGVPKTLHLEVPADFAGVRPEALRQDGRFSPDVWRIFVSRSYLGGPGFQVAFHELDTFGHGHRPPLTNEIPARRWLAYGSSITQGSGATLHHQAYIQQAARRLGLDVLNKGLGGACLCEPEAADFLAAHNGWEIATLELGVNMRGHFTVEEFTGRARYLVEQIAVKHPGKPIFLLNMFPNSSDFLRDASHPLTVANREFREALRSISQQLDLPNLHLLEGETILTDFSALAGDLIHPSDYGHILMGQRLAEEMQSRL